MRETANAYYSHYATSLTYEEADLRAGEEGKEAEFSQFSYNYFYVNVNKFLQGGTTAEDGTVTYSDEERAAAVKAAEAAAKALAESDIASVEDLDVAISAMEINAGLQTADLYRFLDIFLDDMTLDQAQQELGIPIHPVHNDGADLLYALRGTEE